MSAEVSIAESAVEPLNLILVDQDIEPYVLEWPADGDDGDLEFSCLALMRRQEGVLLVLPAGVFPQELLEAGNAGQEGAVGLSKEFEVNSMVMDGGLPHPTGSNVSCLVVDFASTVFPFLRLPRDHEEIARNFDPDFPLALPDPAFLMPLVLDWIQSEEGTLAYYSAEEAPREDQVSPRAPKRRAQPKATAGGDIPAGSQPGPVKSKAKPKRPTNATIAESLDLILQTIPTLSNQIQELSSRQVTLERSLSTPALGPCPALTRPLSTAVSGPPLPVSALAQHVKSPPRTNLRQSPGLLSSDLVQKPSEIQELEAEKLESSLPPNEALARAVYAQSQALTNLVSQIAQNQSDPLVDLGSSSSTGTRGSAGRAKLQSELAAQTGSFFQSVLRSMSRRMAPTLPAEGSPLELYQKGICGTRYMERFGGYAKHRDLGVIQYQVMTAFDYLQTENMSAARDTIALLCVMLEQAVMDGGRLDLAQVLTLQDDLPSGIFVNRQAGVLSRSKSFSPLADQRWITIALAYLKEMDTLQTKRTEIAGGAKSSPEPGNQGQPKAKAQGKKKGRGKGQNQQTEEEET